MAGYTKNQEKYGTGKQTYYRLEGERNEQTWEDASELTLPYIVPPEGITDMDSLPTPYNSIGPSAVNALSSKLLLALLPPTGAFFRLLPDADKLEGVSKEELAQLDMELAAVENEVIEYINIKAIRVAINEALKYLIITGNVALYKIPGGSYKVFNPRQYVIERDYAGNLVRMAIKERISKKVLPINILEQLELEEETTTQDIKDVEEVDIYTMIVRTGPNKITVWQEILDMVVEGTEKSYTDEENPYIVLRLTTTTNDNYGRGLVEQYLGYFRSLEGLTQTIVQGAGIQARHLFGVRPGATVKIEDLNNAVNGDFVMGDLEREISTLQINKTADLQVPFQLMQQLEQRISRAFLLLSGQIRESERTTATEVRATINELESSLGGVFSVLAADLQTPLVSLILKELNPDALKITTVSITTGVSAISREKDFQNLNTMLQSMAQLGPEVLAKYLNVSSYLGQVATSLGMDPYKIVKSPEQIQAEEQQAMEQQQQMMAAQGMANAAEAQASQPSNTQG
jgi:hypothetical protein